MSYYTTFSLNAIGGDWNVIEQFRMQNAEAYNAIDNDGETVNQRQWRRWREDMIEFSELHPQTLFELRGFGEEDGDIWRAFFLNGQSERQDAMIVYDDPPTWTGLALP